jgi:hypothetical protein
MDTQVLFFVAVAAGFTGQFLDVYTTSVAASHGWKETITAPAALLKAFGMTGLTIVKVVGLGLAAPMLTMIVELHFKGPGELAGTAVAAVVAAGGFYAGIVNYLRLKASKISVF